MLNIINNLAPFFEDCYRELGVREYSKLVRVSPPTASKILKDFETQGLLKKREYRKLLLFRANRQSSILKDLSRIYWRIRLKALVEHLNSKYSDPTIILFGSLSNLEAKKDSDIDIVIFSNIKKDINLEKFEKSLKREIQLFVFKSLSNIKSKELKSNILNGYILKGELK